MKKIVFAGLESDALVCIALKVLELEVLGLDEEVQIYHLQEGEFAPEGSYVICTSSGDFPRRFYREITAEDASKRYIYVPEYAKFAQKTFALDRSREALILDRDKNFVAASRQLYLRLRPRAKKVTQVRARKDWTSGHHARKRTTAH